MYKRFEKSKLTKIHSQCEGKKDSRNYKEFSNLFKISLADFDSIKAMFVDQIGSAYKILEVSSDATNEQIKSSYRRLVKIHHPDKIQNLGDSYKKIAKEKFQKIQDAYEKITSGASLLHMISTLIFDGPQSISEINRGLVKLLKQDGFSSIEEAVGSRNPLPKVKNEVKDNTVIKPEIKIA